MSPLDRKIHALNQIVHATLHADYDFRLGKFTEKSVPTRNLRIKPYNCPAKPGLAGRNRRPGPDKRPVSRQKSQSACFLRNAGISRYSMAASAVVASGRSVRRFRITVGVS